MTFRSVPAALKPAADGAAGLALLAPATWGREAVDPVAIGAVGRVAGGLAAGAMRGNPGEGAAAIGAVVGRVVGIAAAGVLLRGDAVVSDSVVGVAGDATTDVLRANATGGVPAPGVLDGRAPAEIRGNVARGNAATGAAGGVVDDLARDATRVGRTAGIALTGAPGAFVPGATRGEVASGVTATRAVGWVVGGFARKATRGEVVADAAAIGAHACVAAPLAVVAALGNAGVGAAAIGVAARVTTRSAVVITRGTVAAVLALTGAAGLVVGALAFEERGAATAAGVAATACTAATGAAGCPVVGVGLPVEAARGGTGKSVAATGAVGRVVGAFALNGFRDEAGAVAMPGSVGRDVGAFDARRDESAAWAATPGSAGGGVDVLQVWALRGAEPLCVAASGVVERTSGAAASRGWGSSAGLGSDGEALTGAGAGRLVDVVAAEVVRAVELCVGIGAVIAGGTVGATGFSSRAILACARS